MVSVPARLRPPGSARRQPLQAFSIRLKIAGYGGVALAMPVLLWQVWRFVTPGLRAEEKP